MGIDYGSKKIGIAFSDDGGTIAFPEAVFKNTPKVFDEIKNIIKEGGIEGIVIGEPQDLKGKPNKISEEAKNFGELIQIETGLAVYREREFMTSTAARHFEGYIKGVRPDTARKTKRESTEVDASAAALILQRYLDRKNAS